MKSTLEEFAELQLFSGSEPRKRFASILGLRKTYASKGIFLAEVTQQQNEG